MNSKSIFYGLLPRSCLPLVMAGVGILLTTTISCSKGSKVFSMKNQGAESVDVNASTGADGSTTGAFSKDAATAQRMTAGAGSGIDGAQLMIPAGALVINTSVTMGQGANNANDALAAALGLGTGFLGSGQSVVLTANPPTDVSNPMQIILPPPSTALYLNSSDDSSWAVLFESLKVGENGTFFSGVIPRSEFTVKDGKAVVSAKHFGTYQVVIPKVEVRAKIEVPGRAADIAANAKIPKPNLTAIKFFNTSTFRIEISGAKNRLGEKFKDYRYTIDDSQPSCNTGISSSEEPTLYGQNPWPSTPIKLKAVTCTQAGEVSEVSEGTYIYDNTAPDTFTVSGPTGTVTSRAPTITWGASNDTNPFSYEVKLALNSPICDGPFVSEVGLTSTSKSVSGLGDGTWHVCIAAVDAAGNKTLAPPSIFTVDATPPNSPIVSANSPTNDTTPTWTWQTGGNGGVGSFRYRLGDGAWNEPTSLTQYTPPAAIAEGSHTLSVQEKDAAGNWSASGSATVIVDTTPPGDVNFSSISPGDVGADLNPVVKGTSDAGTTVKLYSNAACSALISSANGVPNTEFASPGITITVPPNAATDIFAKASDAAGNLSNSCKFLTKYTHDTTQPQVNNVTSDNINQTYKIGDVIIIKVQFTEDVVVTGSPKLKLETGTNDTDAVFLSEAGGVLSFQYTAVEGNVATDLDYVSVTALTGGTIVDLAGNAANMSLFAPGASGSLGSNKDLTIDGIRPFVQQVTSDTSNAGDAAFKKQGDTIAIKINFNENVVVVGTPQLTLETGANDAVVNYASGTNSGSLYFNYTVAAGHSSSELNYKDINSFTLNGGAIKDPAGNEAKLELPALSGPFSLKAKPFVIDTSPPTIELQSTNPISPANNRTPSVSVKTFETNLKVQLFNGAACSVSISNEFYLSGQGIQNINTLELSANIETFIFAKAIDKAGNSTCAGPLSYVHDNTSPTAIINTLSGQALSVSQVSTASPVKFTVTFSESINPTTFDATDIRNDDANLTLTWEVKVKTKSPQDNKDWEVNAIGVANSVTSGTIKPKMLASSVSDITGNGLEPAAQSATSVSFASGTPPARTSNPGDLAGAPERKVVFDGSRYWAFWKTSDGFIKYGLTGSQGDADLSGVGMITAVSNVSRFSVDIAPTSAQYQIAVAYESSGVIFVATGDISSSPATISWSNPASALPGSGGETSKYYGPSVAIDINNKILVAAYKVTSGGAIPEFTKSDLVISASPTFSTRTPLPARYLSPSPGNLSVVRRGDGHMILVSGADGSLKAYDAVSNSATALSSSKSEFELLAGRSGVSLRGNENNAFIKVAKVLNGELYVGGSFDSIGGIAANNVAKWNGWRWIPLGTGANNGVNGVVNDVAYYAKKIYVAGNFSQAGTTTANKIAIWNGSNWSKVQAASGDGPNNVINTMAVGTDGLYVAGAFTAFNNVTVSRIVVYNGTNWSQPGSGLTQDVLALHFAEGVLFAGGVNFLKKLGSGSWLDVSMNIDGDVKCITSDGQGYIYAGGSLRSFGSSSVQKIVKIKISDLVRISFDFDDTAAVINTITYASGFIYAGGSFTGGLKKRSVDTGGWSLLGVGTSGGGVSFVTAFDGGVVGVGSFNLASTSASDNVYSRGIARFVNGGWGYMGHGFTNPIKKLLNVGSDLVLWSPIELGSSALGGVTVNNPTGVYIYSVSSAQFSQLSSPCNNCYVKDVATDGSSIFAAVKNGTQSEVWRYTVTPGWSNFGTVSNVDTESPSVIFVTSREGEVVSSYLHVFLYNTSSGSYDISTSVIGDTYLWNRPIISTHLTGGSPSAMVAINGVLYVGGDFGVKYLGTIREDLGWVDVGTSNKISTGVRSMAFAPDAFNSGSGVLYVGGSFSNASANTGGSTVAVNNLAKISITSGAPGSSWAAIGNSSFGVTCGTGCVPSVNSIKVQFNSILIGGSFSNAAGSPVNNVAMCNTTSGSCAAVNVSDDHWQPISSLENAGTAKFMAGAFGISKLSSDVIDRSYSYSATANPSVVSGSILSMLYARSKDGAINLASYRDQGQGFKWYSDRLQVASGNAVAVPSWPSSVSFAIKGTADVRATWVAEGSLYSGSNGLLGAATDWTLLIKTLTGDPTSASLPRSLNPSSNEFPIFYNNIGKDVSFTW